MCRGLEDVAGCKQMGVLAYKTIQYILGGSWHADLRVLGLGLTRATITASQVSSWHGSLVIWAVYGQYDIAERVDYHGANKQAAAASV
jgi:hypothetical protein